MHFKIIACFLRWSFMFDLTVFYTKIRSYLQKAHKNHKKSYEISTNWMLGLWWNRRTWTRTLFWVLESSVMGLQRTSADKGGLYACFGLDNLDKLGNNTCKTTGYCYINQIESISVNDMSRRISKISRGCWKEEINNGLDSCALFEGTVRISERLLWTVHSRVWQTRVS